MVAAALMKQLACTYLDETDIERRIGIAARASSLNLDFAVGDLSADCIAALREAGYTVSVSVWSPRFITVAWG